MKKADLPTSPNPWAYLVHEERSPWDTAQKLVLAAVLALTLVPGIVFLFIDTAGAAMMLGITALEVLLFHLVLPRRLLIYNTRLTIVLGWPLAWNIPLSSIREARPADAFDTWAYAGVRLATSSKTPVEVLRRRGLNLIISPADRGLFLDRLNEALRASQAPL